MYNAGELSAVAGAAMKDVVAEAGVARMLATKDKLHSLVRVKDSSGLITQLAACKTLAIAASAAHVALARSVAATDGASGVSKSAVVLD